MLKRYLVNFCQPAKALNNFAKATDQCGGHRGSEFCVELGRRGMALRPLSNDAARLPSLCVVSQIVEVLKYLPSSKNNIRIASCEHVNRKSQTAVEEFGCFGKRWSSQNVINYLALTAERSAGFVNFLHKLSARLVVQRQRWQAPRLQPLQLKERSSKLIELRVKQPLDLQGGSPLNEPATIFVADICFVVRYSHLSYGQKSSCNSNDTGDERLKVIGEVPPRISANAILKGRRLPKNNGKNYRGRQGDNRCNAKRSRVDFRHYLIPLAAEFDGGTGFQLAASAKGAA